MTIQTDVDYKGKTGDEVNAIIDGNFKEIANPPYGLIQKISETPDATIITSSVLFFDVVALTELDPASTSVFEHDSNGKIKYVGVDPLDMVARFYLTGDADAADKSVFLQLYKNSDVPISKISPVVLDGNAKTIIVNQPITLIQNDVIYARWRNRIDTIDLNSHAYYLELSLR